MADENEHSQRRGPIKSSVGNIAANRRRQQAVTVSCVTTDICFHSKKAGGSVRHHCANTLLLFLCSNYFRREEYHRCLAFGSPDEQLLEAAWCLTNIAAGEPEQTKSLLPSLPLLILGRRVSFVLPSSVHGHWAMLLVKERS
ncbi:hypothetical protein MKW98_026833 [Papaver atlanticum]|uniref:Uncharacterized protein n=1 Tax=Papaver atlanticum TaxID=357466 RepID=A0AAD4X6W2_9MAGN|nr:hypothetical protein MKW98_026833 [Papaver atlanticum]